MCLHIAQDSRLDPTVRKIEARAAGSLFALRRLPSVHILDLRRRKLHRGCVSVRRELIDDRSPWIPQPQQLCNLVERLPGRIIACAADIFITPDLTLLLGKVQVRVAAGNHQGQQRESQLVITFLSFLQ